MVDYSLRTINNKDIPEVNENFMNVLDWIEPYVNIELAIIRGNKSELTLQSP